jgi:hydroxymethylpyrimidine pyrophosphatase-like HAD family hydrolase
MKLKALALDYDGTIAEDGRLAGEVRTALERARAAGLTVLIVTGRIIGDLRRVAGDLSFADAVVGENGAVITFPRSGRSTALHRRPVPEFLDGLQKRGVEFKAGETIVEADASAAPVALDLIRKLELPLVILFNRGRMMILPQAISKATGLAAALDTFRLSAHNVLAIGDAENDHELLRSAEVGVAVEWGSPALKRVADEVLAGRGPAAVAGYIDQLLAGSGRLRIRRPRRRVVLGTTRGGNEISLAVSGRNVVISGDPRSGKSWVGGLLCEQLILHGYSVCIIDPEGDYASLEALPRVLVVGGDDPPPQPHDLLRLLRHPDRSIVLNLSRLSHAEKCDYLGDVLPQITVVRQRTGLPHRVLVDEAHYFLCDLRAMALLDMDSGGCTAVTYRASHLHPDVLRAADVLIVTQATDPDEIAALARVGGGAVDLEEWKQVLTRLAVDEAALLPGAEEAEGRLRLIRLAERLTPHVRHRTKYLDVPVTDHHAFVFSKNGRPSGERAHTLKEFVDVLGRTDPECLQGHLERGDFSKWIAGVFGDRPLAGRIRKLEESHRLGHVSDINDSIIEAIRARYEFADR